MPPKDAKEETALAQAPVDAQAALALAMQGGMETGFEETSSSDFIMPMLLLLQALSPQVNPAKPKYIPNAKAGQFLDVTTGELLDTVNVIPCLYKPQMVEWKPERGGFVSSHDHGIEQGLPRNEKGKWVMPSGNILDDTRYFYCLRIKDNGDLTPVIIALTSTQIPKAKEWMTTMLSKTTKNKAGQSTPYPIYLWRCKITAVPESKGQNSWFGWKIVLDRMINQDEAKMLVAAQEARTTFQASASKMKPPMEDDTTPGAGENSHLG